MCMQCFFRHMKPLQYKNIELIYECHEVNYTFSSIEHLYSLLKKVALGIENKLGVKITCIEFYSNEPIGSDYIIYKFHLLLKELNNTYCSCRLITYRNEVKLIVCTISNAILKYLPQIKISTILKKDMYHPRLLKPSRATMKGMPKGQKIIPNFIIYRILDNHI